MMNDEWNVVICVLVNRGQSCSMLLTCSMTPMACVWLSYRAGVGGAGIAAIADILSRSVPDTRVLDTQSTQYVTNYCLYQVLSKIFHVQAQCER